MSRGVPIDREKVAQALQDAANGLSLRAAVEKNGLLWWPFQRYCNEDAELSEMREKAVSASIQHRLDVAVDKCMRAENRDSAAAGTCALNAMKFLAERRLAHLYGARQTVAIETSVSEDLDAKIATLKAARGQGN